MIHKNIIIVHATGFGACPLIRQHALSMLAESGMLGEIEFIRSRSVIKDPGILMRTAAIWFLRPATNLAVKCIEQYRALKTKFRFRLVADFDDLLWDSIPEYNDAGVDTKETLKLIAKIVPILDNVTVSTQFLKDAWEGRFKTPATVVRNTVPRFLYGRNRHECPEHHPQIFYTGSSTHCTDKDPGDLAGPWIPWMKEHSQEYGFHFFGEVPPGMENSFCYVHPRVHMVQFPGLLRELNPDFLIAPLQENDFNKAKSDLKFLEAGALGVPLIGSWWEDSCPYAMLPTECRVTKDTTPEGLDKMFKVLMNPRKYDAVTEYQRAVMDHYQLWTESDRNMDLVLQELMGPYLEIER